MDVPIDLPLISRISDVLKTGSPVIMPCDTIYGIVGIVPESENQIRNIKGREESNPFLMLILKKWVNKYTNTEIPEELLNLWPGPLTLVVEGTGRSSIAVRVPDDKRLLAIMETLNKPLFSTSVNRSGEEPLNNGSEIEKQFKRDLSLIINEGNLLQGAPSTILDIRERPYKVLRQGSLVIDEDFLK